MVAGCNCFMMPCGSKNVRDGRVNLVPNSSLRADPNQPFERRSIRWPLAFGHEVLYTGLFQPGGLPESSQGSQRSADPWLAVGRIGASWRDASALRPLRVGGRLLDRRPGGVAALDPRLLSGKPSACPGSDREPNFSLEATGAALSCCFVLAQPPAPVPKFFR